MTGAISRGGCPVVGFGSSTSSSWHEQAIAKIVAMDRLIAAGRGDELVPGGGCTEPGGGIAPVARTARETAALLRAQLGLGQVGVAAPTVAAAGTSPWAVALTTSVVGAAAGWVIEEITRAVRGRGKRNRDR